MNCKHKEKLKESYNGEGYNSDCDNLDRSTNFVVFNATELDRVEL